MYVYDCYAIRNTSMKNTNYKEIIRVFTSLTEDLKTRGIHPGLHVMDNKSSTALKLTTTTMKIKYQLVTTINHRANNAEISI